ncbi:MBL fold metallo-hydrolase [Roseomonas sp. NAR14]|uniref:MBL fold metallo-hydrolase n=1 Tax=Roseomonas acroporae TaxID=2937791 RepID=A0A9X1Y5U1_9PROT|nr:MBL fold metallo-hydrolase [Roseomonas acroporae]
MQAAILPVTPFQQNCTLLWEPASKRAAVVDPGGEVDRILAAVAQLGLRVEKILLTHGHLDHAGGAAELRERLLAAPDAPAAIPIEGPDERDRFLLEGLARQGAAYGMPGLRDVTPDRWLKEGDTVDVGDQRFRVLHCPGHTPGHVVFLHDGLRFALVGDVLFQGSVGRTDFPYGDTAALLASIRDKLLPLGDDWQFVCGHGPGSSIGAERRSNPFLG